MMKLENMVQVLASDTVAQRLIQFWEYDEGTLELWRASSNFVYAFERNQVQYFLRFSFEQDKSIEQLKAELEYMQYLHLNGFPTVTPIQSISGELIETLMTPEGTYIAVVFSAANGINLNSDTITDKQMEEWGKSLGSLHCLAKKFEPGSERRKSWLDTVQFMESVFQKHPTELIALEELDRVTAWLQSIPTGNDVYGLIHYDFQLDNIFFEENKNHSFNVIDFDDAMYHWYALDIVTALDDFIDDDNPHSKLMIQSFLNGYRSKMVLENDVVAQFPQYQRYANLYKFSKLLRSMDYEEINDTPHWFDELKVKLVRVADELRKTFQISW
ncbi:aminoglycoside phosphotransferase [Bacillus sp. FJAT-22090]|uniref:phosphotransferase enzyme family protein n=1 Tax=Bacillus sp. FJAT-22090 TaxID=1581038 RepID=UPI0006AFD4C6|nr:phosphotransferase [Bacillus sp. FJAT-22090]ALC85180.1 aminoglycoside phosphotransferase [Bacillus sp. FJAT-22090]